MNNTLLDLKTPITLFTEMVGTFTNGLIASDSDAGAGQDKRTYRNQWRDIARPEQLAPEGDWRIWLIQAGRGFGKTRTINEWGIEQAKAQPGSRGAIVGATAADVRDVIIEGESGIVAISQPDFRPVFEPSKRRLTWPNGSMATTYSADEPERLRGPQHHWAIGDELAAWRYPLAFDMLMLGLRLGADPRAAFATTPKPTRLLKKLLKDINTIVTRGSTYANRANLAPAFFTQIIKQYEGTRLGRQELNGELLEDVEGALWTLALIEAVRVEQLPDLERIVVAIDPSTTNSETSDEAGIIAAGLGKDKHGYVLDDKSLRASPLGWAQEAVKLYRLLKADRIIGEANNGGDMIETIIRSIDGNISYRKVHASRGKLTRAEPVSALYEQKRVHHYGVLPDLENEMTSWVPGADSPNRMDALVWVITDLMIGGGPVRAETW